MDFNYFPDHARRHFNVFVLGFPKGDEAFGYQNGLRVGDILVSVNSTRVLGMSFEDFCTVLRRAISSGETLILGVHRFRSTADSSDTDDNKHEDDRPFPSPATIVQSLETKLGVRTVQDLVWVPTVNFCLLPLPDAVKQLCYVAAYALREEAHNRLLGFVGHQSAQTTNDVSRSLNSSPLLCSKPQPQSLASPTSSSAAVSGTKLLSRFFRFSEWQIEQLMAHGVRTKYDLLHIRIHEWRALQLSPVQMGKLVQFKRLLFSQSTPDIVSILLGLQTTVPNNVPKDQDTAATLSNPDTTTSASLSSDADNLKIGQWHRFKTKFQ